MSENTYDSALQPVLSMQEVAVHFGGVRAVDGLTASVAPGELLGLIGPNGSGKSTLLGAVSRLTPLTSGVLTLEGTRYDHITAAATATMGIARTFQTVRLLPRLNVVENVMVGAFRSYERSLDAQGTSRWRRGPRREEKLRKIALAALSRVGLADLGDTHPDALPYGLQRKVEIARALAAEPKVLLLDEPTAGMSHRERDEIAGLISQLNSEGLAQILVEHDIAMMVSVCPRLVVMSQGRLIAEGPADVVVRQKNVQEAYLGGEYHAAAGN